jgi:hypothetical protein
LRRRMCKTAYWRPSRVSSIRTNGDDFPWLVK